jgi:DNA-binding MarR family transcriptional regulator
MRPADPIRSVLDDIRHIVRALRISSRANEQAYGLGAAQLFVLKQLGDQEAISINELAARTMTHQSSVSVVVSKLVEQGLVSRTRSSADSRRVEISLTARGLRRSHEAPRPPQEALVGALQAMEPAERERLAELLSQLVVRAGYARGEAPLLFEDEAAASPREESAP